MHGLSRTKLVSLHQAQRLLPWSMGFGRSTERYVPHSEVRKMGSDEVFVVWFAVLNFCVDQVEKFRGFGEVAQNDISLIFLKKIIQARILPRMS